jgi:TolB-like protein/tetratricopeptide (TPR) repeat protein
VADVFLSYKREDAAKAGKLVAALRTFGLDVWWDEDIPPSAPWEATIERALSDAKTVIVCWSPASVASENVRSEARVARQDGRLIQSFLKPCDPPLFFGERQGVDLTRWRGNADDPRIAALADTVRKIASGERVAGADAPRSRPSHTRLRVVALVALLVLVLVAGTLIAWRAAVARPAPEVAVLPFDDLSPTHDKGYFAEGVAEEILSSLSTDKKIRVLGRTSSRQIDRNADPKALRKSLGITHLLEGSARTSGDALRVDVRLIDTRDGTTVWQDEYQGRMADVFSVQDKIASAVVQHVRGIFAPAGAIVNRPATDADAYDLYLAARALLRTRSEPTLRKALGLAKRVIDAQPNYAPGQALYAELVMHLSDDPLEYGDIPVEQARRIARAHALKAVQLSPNTADGYGALGLILAPSDEIAPLKRAIALDPSRADFRIWLEEAYAKLGRYDEAFQQAQQAAEIEPLWAASVNRVVLILASSRRFDEALKAVQHFESIGGDRAQALRFRAAIARRQGDHARSIFYIDQALKIDPTVPYIGQQRANEYHLLGLSERARAALPNENEPLLRLFINDQQALIVERARSANRELLDAPDVDFAIFALGAARAWGPLANLYRNSGMNPAAFCSKLPTMSLPVELPLHVSQALAATGSQAEANALLDCVSRRLDRTFAQTYRWGDETGAEPEFGRALSLGLRGDRNGGIAWMNRAIQLGWLGYPYSSRLLDWPEFDGLRGDPRLAELQAKIDRTVARQRAQVIAQGG